MFIDDFSIQSLKTIHHDYIKTSLQRCKKAKIALNYYKILLAIKREVLLGYIVLKKGRKSNPKKVNVMVESIHFQ